MVRRRVRARVRVRAKVRVRVRVRVRIGLGLGLGLGALGDAGVSPVLHHLLRPVLRANTGTGKKHSREHDSAGHSSLFGG